MALLASCIVLPLATALVPLLALRRIPRRKRKPAWQLVVSVVTGVTLGVIGAQAGKQAALADRGEWTDALVVHKRKGRTDRCTLRIRERRETRETSPLLSESDGCAAWVSEGDVLRVRYDPKGVASPTVRPGRTSYGEFLVALMALAVFMGTWGALRQSRWDREYNG